MWLNLLTGRVSLALGLLLLAASHFYSYQQGHQRGIAQHNTAHQAQLSACQQARQQLLAQMQVSLTAQQAEQQRQLAQARQVSADYRQQMQHLQVRYQQLKRQRDDITTHFMDDRAQKQALPTGFTRGFVQQVNAAFGLSADTDSRARRAQSTSGTVSGVDPRLRLSGLTQRELLDWLLDTGKHCQALRAQVNSLLDIVERETP
ncbi:hypothetical protein CBG25_05045 [Arsenophonus sp. ENCA]|uniref:hypothetical protein n=1 Tax=Arsenophonus sp. ENCA TaxID=1987579 RepID=UPI000BD5B463|nr:hypothetical protein [Arsenophonus sp. ENCA]PAV07257.1 hypothetical protein CBG25_05045 [Arsenophonus sp. ENCA]